MPIRVILTLMGIIRILNCSRSSDLSSVGGPRRSKVRFAPTFFYSCGTKERHPPAPLLLLSKPNPLCWALVWFWVQTWEERHLYCFDITRRSKLYIACSDFFTKVRARSFRCSSFPTANRFAGFAVGFGCKPESLYLESIHAFQFVASAISLANNFL